MIIALSLIYKLPNRGMGNGPAQTGPGRIRIGAGHHTLDESGFDDLSGPIGRCRVPVRHARRQARAGEQESPRSNNLRGIALGSRSPYRGPPPCPTGGRASSRRNESAAPAERYDAHNRSGTDPAEINGQGPDAVFHGCRGRDDHRHSPVPGSGVHSPGTLPSAPSSRTGPPSRATRSPGSRCR